MKHLLFVVYTLGICLIVFVLPALSQSHTANGWRLISSAPDDSVFTDTTSQTSADGPYSQYFGRMGPSGRISVWEKQLDSTYPISGYFDYYLRIKNGTPVYSFHYGLLHFSFGHGDTLYAADAMYLQTVFDFSWLAISRGGYTSPNLTHFNYIRITVDALSDTLIFYMDRLRMDYGGYGSDRYRVIDNFGDPRPDAVREIPNAVPHGFMLSEAYPNPFNPSTHIRFELPRETDVSVSVWNVLGKQIELLFSGHSMPGVYEAEWNSARYPSGIYYVRYQTPEAVETRKIILMR